MLGFYSSHSTISNRSSAGIMTPYPILLFPQPPLTRDRRVSVQVPDIPRFVCPPVGATQRWTPPVLALSTTRVSLPVPRVPDGLNPPPSRVSLDAQGVASVTQRTRGNHPDGYQRDDVSLPLPMPVHRWRLMNRTTGGPSRGVPADAPQSPSPIDRAPSVGGHPWLRGHRRPPL